MGKLNMILHLQGKGPGCSKGEYYTYLSTDENKEIINLGIISCSNAKFSELTL